MEEDVLESTEVDTPESSVEVTEEPSGEAYTVKVDGEEQEVSLKNFGTDTKDSRITHVRRRNWLPNVDGYSKQRRLCLLWSQIQREPYRL